MLVSFVLSTVLLATNLTISWEVAKANSAITQSAPNIVTTYDSVKDRTTIQLLPMQVSGEKGIYYRLHIAVSCTYPTRTPPAQPQPFEFELQSIVKGRKLNPDLYIVFVVDGEIIFLSSNRAAVKNPVPGRRMIGERIVMRMPFATLLKLADAQQATVKMGGTSFELGDSHRSALKALAERMKP